MTHGHGTGQVLQDIFGENLRNKPHGFVNGNLSIIRGYYTGTLLPSVLLGIQAKISQFGRIFVSKDTTHTAFMFGTPIFHNLYTITIHSIVLCLLPPAERLATLKKGKGTKKRNIFVPFVKI
jgi:hypothetical protein